ncbi:MAG: hypothetical protein HY435_02370 [Candidatus Liptonbacteria bacterium]|nr:hypothetical protein [Candidatus Liptonbacteria bacterium]
MTAQSEGSGSEDPAPQPEVHACIICCPENQRALYEYVEKNGPADAIVKMFGGAKLFISKNDADLEYAKKQLRTAIKWQGVSVVVLMLHDNCVFRDVRGNPPDAREELRRAAGVVTFAFSRITVKKVLANEETFHKIE